MKRRLQNTIFGLSTAVVILSVVASPAAAQWLHRPTPGIPRTKDGKPDLSAPAPKLADGKPDLGGIWLVPGLKYLINIAADLKEVPFQPWAEAEYKRRMETKGKDDPNNFCLPSGIPEKDAVTSPVEDCPDTRADTYSL